MNAPWLSAALCGSAAVVAVGAQYIAAGDPFFHTWQYAAILALLAAFALRSARGRDAQVPVVGALIIIAGGLASGLLGADTQTLVRSPGTVTPIPDVDAAAFFPVVDARTIATPPAIAIRRRGHPELTIAGGATRYLGASILSAVPRVVAFVDVRDAAGSRLTVTQPANVTFLSPVLLFTRTEAIDGKSLPADSFAVPAAHRLVRVLYFSPEATAKFNRAAAVSGKAAVLFAMTDEGGVVMPGQIAVALSGQEVSLERLRVRATLATYPALRLASAPHPLPFALGTLVFLGGFLMPRVLRKPLPAPTSEVLS